MRFTTREIVLALLALAVGLFGGTALVIRPRLAELRQMRTARAGLRAEIEADMKLVDRRETFGEQLAELSERLPVYPADKKMDIHWLSLMDNIAAKHGVRITKRQAGDENRNGDLYELGIECKQWEADLDAMVHFLFDLQEEGAMLNGQQLLIKPKGNNVLRGRFFLNCAYTKQPVPATE